MLTWWPIPSRSGPREPFPSRNRTCTFPRIRLEPPVSTLLCYPSFWRVVVSRYWDSYESPSEYRCLSIGSSRCFHRTALFPYLLWSRFEPGLKNCSYLFATIKSGHWWPSLLSFNINLFDSIPIVTIGRSLFGLSHTP